eukprot:COSAG05_NODE_28_length_29121_cov_56.951933_10_plen_95_part_00
MRGTGLSNDDENESDSGSSSGTGRSSWRDWVVLTRHNSTARRIGRKLAENGVPVHVPGSEQRWVPVIIASIPFCQHLCIPHLRVRFHIIRNARI